MQYFHGESGTPKTVDYKSRMIRKIIIGSPVHDDVDFRENKARVLPDHSRRKPGPTTLPTDVTGKPEGIFEAHFPNSTEPVEMEYIWAFGS